MAQIIDGKAVAGDIIARVKELAPELGERLGVKPGLAVIIVGTDPASEVYVASKGRMAKECGFHSEQHKLAEDTTQDDLLALVNKLNNDPAIHGILVQLPLPKQIDSGAIIQAVAAEKDVDGFSYLNVGKIGSGNLATALVSCTPAGCMILIDRVIGKDLSGLNAVVVGRSNIVGKPMASLLLAANATVTIAHSRTKDLASICRTADILVAAVGQPHIIKGDWIKPGAIVIDVGTNRMPGSADGKTRLIGDVDFAAASQVAAAITPVPGGVGPMTIAMLMANTLTAMCLISGQPRPTF